MPQQSSGPAHNTFPKPMDLLAVMGEERIAFIENVTAIPPKETSYAFKIGNKTELFTVDNVIVFDELEGYEHSIVYCEVSRA